MPYRFSAEDVAFLDSDEGWEALGRARTLPLGRASLISDLTGLRAAVGEHAAAVAETALMQRRAAIQWGIGDEAAGRWLFTDEALQQASPPAVAAHRASRFIEADLAVAAIHDVTCSVGADLAQIAAVATCAGLLAIGSDLDPVRLAMARHNLRALGLHASLLVADARSCITRRALRYADPARRDAAGRRISSWATIPSVSELDAASPGAPLVLRLPPGIDYERLGREGEIEIVSWNGAVREAVSWPTALATVRRRATVLRSGPDGTSATELTDADPAEESVTPAARYLVDPDPAMVRAHLVQQYAARHGLTRIDEHLAYLTGDRPPDGVRAFEVLDQAAFTERVVREWVRRDGVGTLEIKQRGTPVVPDELRKRVKPTGDTRVARTLIVARVGRCQRAFWCRAQAAGIGSAE